MSDSMRILLVVNEFPPEKIAGTAMATQALAGQLEARGHEVMVVVTTSCPVEREEQIKTADYELVWLKPRPFFGSGSFYRIFQTWRHARRFKPQLIQGQAVSCGLMAAVVGKLLGIPSICYAQGYDVFQATRWQKWTEIRWGCRWPDSLLAVTRELAGAIHEVIGEHPLQIMPHAFLLPDTLMERGSAREKFNLPGAACVVLSVGRLEPFKGHDVLLQAWPLLLEQKPEVRLWIAGSGSCQVVLQQQAKQLGIESSVHFAGQLAADDVHRLMASADLFVLPSRSEPFGIVLLEAMAHGLPVVASRVGGIPEVVPESGAVELVETDDPGALATAMLSQLQLTVPSIENRDHAMQFEWTQQVGRFESIYQELVR